MDAAEIDKLGRLEDRHWWYAERRWLLRQALGASATPGARALDVGAAAGGNTRVLRSAGYECLALEYGETGAVLARGRGLTVVRGDATALPLADATIDVVVAFDVLEHIPDDKSAAAELYRCLKPGGRVVVAVPCDMRLWSAHDVAVDHVRRYERAELVSLVEGAGFTDVEVRSWMVLLRPVVALRRRSSSGSDLDEPGRVTNAVLRSVVVAERYLPVRSAPGVSLLLTAVKPGG
jgi:SAM-dependent methyltransferase